jgi:hypothetical protein
MKECEFVKMILREAFGVQNYQEMLDKLKTRNVLVSMNAVNSTIIEVAEDAPKHYITTDYTHDFGDPQSPDYIHPKKEDYPRYIHIPDDEEWLAWFNKWFGSATKGEA